MADNLAFGFASLNGGTSGGSGGTIVTVSTGAQLQAAIDAHSSSAPPLTIRIDGTITLANTGAETIRVDGRNNLSIVGAADRGELDGIGLHITGGSSNLIIRNLEIHSVRSGLGDAISIEGPSRNIWIDSNELYSSMAVPQDYYDGLLDIKRGAEYITVSNNYFHDHHKVSLVGFTDTDVGARYITYALNIFENVGSRVPSVRDGYVHIYNNLYRDIETSGINLRMGAVGLIENNVFINARDPIVSLDSAALGFWDLRGNLFQNVTWSSPGTGEAIAGSNNEADTASYDVPYAYTLLTVEQVSALVGVNIGDGPGTVPGGGGTDPPPPPPPPPSGATGDADTLAGTAQDDVIDALGGRDSVLGNAGNDTLLGGTNNDTLRGGEGRESLLGGTGADLLAGDAGDDILFGQDGRDTLEGGAGNDTLDGGALEDRLAGGAGNDVYITDAGDIVVEAAWQGIDRILTTAAALTLPDHVEHATGLGPAHAITGNALANNLTGGAGADTLVGRDGRDRLDGDAGTDSLVGGAGDDFYFVTPGDIVVEAVAEGIDTVRAATGTEVALAPEVEVLLLAGAVEGGIGNGLDNRLIGNGAANLLAGGDGADTLQGMAGNDTLNGGTGADSLVGGLGNDTYMVQDGDKVVEFAGQGADVVIASGGPRHALGANLETLVLGNGASIGLGNAAANALWGNGEGNILYGLGGNDSLFGQDGDDRLVADAGTDTLTGGAGFDRFIFTPVADSPPDAPDLIADFTFRPGERDLILLAALDADTTREGDQAFAFRPGGFTGAAGDLQAIALGGTAYRLEADTDGNGVADLAILVQSGTAPVAGWFIL